MGRASRADAARHRQEIVTAASQLLRERGAEAVSVQEAMAAVGLTHGGFYKHFGSKGELFASAAGVAFDDITHTLDRIAAESADEGDARRRVFDEYLAGPHRDDAAHGCANTALAADAARTDDPAFRAAYTEGLQRTVARLAEIEGDTQDRRAAIADLIVLVGGLTLARATAGDPVSDEILEVARGLARR